MISRRKKLSKQLSEPAVCESKDDCLIPELRDVQKGISEIKDRISNINHDYYPMVYLVIHAILKSSIYILPYSHIRRSDELITRGEIQDVILRMEQTLADNEIIPQIEDCNGFDIERFCMEFKEIFRKEESRRELEKNLTELRSKEKELKDTLKIE